MFTAGQGVRFFKKISFFGICMAALCGCLLLGGLKATGMCLSEGRYLSERELLERYVLASRDFKIGADYLDAETAKAINFPDCCRLYLKPQFGTLADVYLRPFLFGERLYGVEVYYLDQSKVGITGVDPARQIYSDIESCGKKSDIDRYSMSISLDEYNRAVKRFGDYWRDKKS